MMNLLALFGRKVTGFFRQIGQITFLIMRVLRYMPRVAKDRRLVLEQMSIVGTESLPLVILIGAFTGAI
ncbi:MAG: hypothetical protein ACKO0Y_02770, partial [Bacteroidota bacterium]